MSSSTAFRAVAEGPPSRTRPSFLQRDQIFELAEQVGETLGFAGSHEADVADFAAQQGGRILYFDDTRIDQLESLIVKEKGSFEILLPDYTSEARDRFTIGHEMGHYYLHFLIPTIIRKEPTPLPARFNRFGTDRAEIEANQFAAALLMPAGPFRACWAEADGDLFQVARAFRLSRSACRVRAESLNLAVA